MRKLTAKQKSEIEVLTKLPDDKINTSDIPEAVFTDQAVVGKFYRPIKKPISVRLDADVLAWLKHSGPGYQRRINDILRREMAQGNKRR
ncbi:BrnA antitoxin family protein [uncultured Paludibaculum sp.]|uniref:BrnA antitoxin family protein n=1 Tax=uncultured Paludibaculum sp. TaxID=1765020 RepID=UPI002AAB969D|nr:BrnA antitoxin family protein [uncultured Paludibaculum sp.]